MKEVKKENEQKQAKYLFDEYIEMWLESQKQYLKESTYYGYSRIIKKHIIPYFKPLKIELNELKVTDIQKYYGYLLEVGLNPNSIKRHHANIRKALQDAVNNDIILYNVADRARLPNAKKYHANIYNGEQLQELIRVVKGTAIESAVMLTVYFDLRRGEVCGLKWENVDFENNIIHIKNTRIAAREEIFQESTKNESSTRTLPMNEEIYTYLRKLKEQQKEDAKL